MNIKQSASTLVILAAVALVGAGCLSSSKPGETRPIVSAKPTLNVPPEVLGQDTPSVARQETTTTFATGPDGSMVTTVSEDTTTVRDATSGLTFSVPTSLGEIRTQDENGFGTEGTKSGDGSSADCLVQRSFLAGDVIFLTNYDTFQCDQPGRGGYWGDQAQAFKTEADIEKWCKAKDACDTFANKSGITIYHAFTRSVEEYGTTYAEIDEYGAWNAERSVHGVLFSNEGFVQAGAGRQLETLKSIVDSLSFYVE
ncbi:MAG: hypothetical protein WCO25_02280 [Candidatus Uhrbacteria bacterium]